VWNVLQPISQGFADCEVAEFLSVLKLGTRNVYSRGLAVFQQFYSSQGSIRDFLDCVERDRLLPRSERRRVDRLMLNSFVVWLFCGFMQSSHHSKLS
jgi:hypothetical protein